MHIFSRSEISSHWFRPRVDPLRSGHPPVQGAPIVAPTCGVSVGKSRIRRDNRWNNETNETNETKSYICYKVLYGLIRCSCQIPNITPFFCKGINSRNQSTSSWNFNLTAANDHRLLCWKPSLIWMPCRLKVNESMLVIGDSQMPITMVRSWDFRHGFRFFSQNQRIHKDPQGVPVACRCWSLTLLTCHGWSRVPFLGIGCPSHW